MIAYLFSKRFHGLKSCFLSYAPRGNSSLSQADPLFRASVILTRLFYSCARQVVELSCNNITKPRRSHVRTTSSPLRNNRLSRHLRMGLRTQLLLLDFLAKRARGRRSGVTCFKRRTLCSAKKWWSPITSSSRGRPLLSTSSSRKLVGVCKQAGRASTLDASQLKVSIAS